MLLMIDNYDSFTYNLSSTSANSARTCVPTATTKSRSTTSRA